MAYEYKVGGKTVSLQVDDTLVAVRFREPAPTPNRAAYAARLGITPFETRVELPGEKFTIFPIAGEMRSLAMPARETIAASPDVVRVSPVFRVGNRHILATDRLLIGFKSDVSEENARQFIARRGYTLLEKIGESYLVRLPENSDPFAQAQKLGETPKVAFAEPDFVTVGRHTPKPPSRVGGVSGLVGPGTPPSGTGLDPLLSRQYAMAAIQADKAWDAVGPLKNTVRIAILDEGVDRHHEDLRVEKEYDATGDDLDQQPNMWDGHGTACAGLAAAISRNDLGIRGVASGFPILAVRIAYSASPGSPWSTSNSIIARAIQWAWQNGADVLSNSWGGGAPSSAIAAAFEEARTRGRNGKGCMIAVAAGNENAWIGFPADLPNMLTVTASNEWDEPKTPTSRDGEYWWGSCFGPAACIAAPGVHNYTTDIAGEAGYSQGGLDSQGRLYSSNYTPDFNGTSSATPLVAGAAALLLSLNPDLREEQVRGILCTTADKVGGVYDAQGRNPRMGFGRLNVFRAVTEVLNVGSAPIDDQGKKKRKKKGRR